MLKFAGDKSSSLTEAKSTVEQSILDGIRLVRSLDVVGSLRCFLVPHGDMFLLSSELLFVGDKYPSM